MGSQTIVAAVHLRHCKRYGVTRLDVKGFGQVRLELRPAVEYVGIVGHQTVKIGHKTEKFVDIVQNRFGISMGVVASRNRNTGHSNSPVVVKASVDEILPVKTNHVARNKFH